MPVVSDTVTVSVSSRPRNRPFDANWRFWRSVGWKLVLAYFILLAVTACLGRWTSSFLEGRDLWHFAISRMVVPLVMLGVVASVVRLVPAICLTAAALLFVGAISAIKREATGEPFQVSDLFLAEQSHHLLNYVGWEKWLMALPLLPAVFYAGLNLRFRWWSAPLVIVCVGLLSTYRFETVVKLIHDNAWRIGVENLTFSQAESERMNGLATHLYFSTAGLRLKIFSDSEVRAALAELDAGPLPLARSTPAPDIYLVLGEAWWRDPTDQASPLDRLVAAGFLEASAISPVYGGTTPNAEFEVLTAVPVKSFQSGIIPYQHYHTYFSKEARSLPRLLAGEGYSTRALHNFTRRFWLRDQIYPRLGFQQFDSMDNMQLVMQDNGWPTDDGLYARALEFGTQERAEHSAPLFQFLVTVATHGPYREDRQSDLIDGNLHPGIADYRQRLGGAVDAMLTFEAKLRSRGRPYVIVIFGDHLPGLRLHQWKSGMTSESDPRLRSVPVLVASNSENEAELQARLEGQPLTCLAPALVDWLRLGIEDRYFRFLSQRCNGNGYVAAIPSDAVIQNQLFSERPQP